MVSSSGQVYSRFQPVPSGGLVTGRQHLAAAATLRGLMAPAAASTRHVSGSLSQCCSGLRWAEPASTLGLRPEGCTPEPPCSNLFIDRNGLPAVTGFPTNPPDKARLQPGFFIAEVFAAYRRLQGCYQSTPEPLLHWTLPITQAHAAFSAASALPCVPVWSAE